MKTGLYGLIGALYLAGAPAITASVEYQLAVRGLSCAFCAYRATQQLAALPGVERDSVFVDVKTDEARLTSQDRITPEAMAQALEQAGFALTASKEITAADTASTANPNFVLTARLQIDVSEIAGSMETVLKVLGAAAAEHGGFLSVEATKAMEMHLASSLLMGKRVTVPLQFSSNDGKGTATLEWHRPVKE